uniref:Retrovirus-related Pol polyprotein from transposon TNT 1-94 n=1 Tax=Tanacetum cinerariifolium TaxID=118510 RepID=A0A6L2MAP7_TANCI|nr:retrovirus-related Pol polyprotein from transposon TNT 1-94 [Tanacetum cinerariifolium]
MTIETHNLSSSSHQELHKIVKDENFPIINQVDARVQNFEIQFLKEAAKFIGDFKSLTKEADESLAKHKALELEIERLLRAVVGQDIMSVMQNNSVIDTSNLQTELERTRERFENCIIEKENEYAKLWNDWYKKCEECKFDKISYDKAYNDMQRKIERLQAQLGDLKGKSKDTSCVSDTLNPLSQKLENENVELEFRVLNYAKENAHDNKCGTSMNTKFAKQSILGKPPTIGETQTLSKPVTSNSILKPQESKVMKNDKVISPGMFRINPSKTSREEKHVPNTLRASDRTKLITVSQPPVFTKKDANVSIKENHKKQKPKVKKTKKVGFIERLATLKTSKPRSFLRWSPTGRLFDLKGKIIASRQFCDSNLEVAFRRNACFIRNLEGVDLLKEDHSTNLYTINLHDMASASPIRLIARASSTKSWLWHQRLSHLNFDTINDLAKNDHVLGLPKFKYHNEHLCPSWEQGKSKRASHLPKLVPNSRQRSKDEAPEVIKAFLKRITILLQSPVIIIRNDNGTEFKNQVLKEYFDSVGISHQVSSVQTPQQNGVVERRNRMLVEAARTMLIFSRALLFLWAEVIATACFTQNRSIIHRRFNKTPYELINGRKPNISFLHVFGALCYPKNDREYIRKLGEKGDIGFFIGYSVNSRAYRIYNQRTNKIMETMNISSRLDLTYALSTITTQQPTKGELDLLFEVMYDDYIGGQPSAAQGTVLAAQAQQNVKEAMTDPAWIESMQEELLQFKRIDVWVLVPAPDNISPLSLKWIFKNKNDEKNTVIQNKSRLVVRGIKRRRVRGQPEGFIDADRSSHVYKLKKALYGLKQAPRVWYDELSTFLLQNHFFKGTIDPTLFIRHFDDDILVSNYVLEILKKYGMESCDPVGTPMEIKDKLDLDQNGTLVDATKYHSMIGALMYLTSSRPDIVHAACLCARYQAKLTEKHLKEVKRIFRYLQGTVNTGLWYTKDSGFELTGFSDADYAGCKETFKSTSGEAQFLGEKLVSWSLKKQDCTALSTAEAEYVSLSTCCAQVLWMRTQLTDYGFHFKKIPIYYDSKSAIAISCNLVQYSRTKHIAICYHFIKEHVEKGTIELYFVKTDYQLADLFTKALPTDRFNYLVRHLGMRSLSPQELDCLAKSQ